MPKLKKHRWQHRGSFPIQGQHQGDIRFACACGAKESVRYYMSVPLERATKSLKADTMKMALTDIALRNPHCGPQPGPAHE